MKQEKTDSLDVGKLLRNTIRQRRWSIIGGVVVGAQTLLNIFTHPDESGAVLFHVILALGCIGYGLSLTPRIRKLSQAYEEIK